MTTFWLGCFVKFNICFLASIIQKSTTNHPADCRVEHGRGITGIGHKLITCPFLTNNK